MIKKFQLTKFEKSFEQVENKSREQELWTKFVNRSFEPKLWTKVVSYEYKMWTQAVTKKMGAKALNKSCEQKM